MTTLPLSVPAAADELGVTPSRVRSLIACGALTASGDGVDPAGVAELTRRGTVRSADVAAFEGAVDRALRRRLPALLGEALVPALAPLSGEVALAFADVEVTTRELAEAREAGRVLQAELVAARERVALLERQVAALQEPVGLFRRRRSAAPA